MSNIQEKLQLIFPQSFQVKRMLTQIQQLSKNRQKLGYYFKMSSFQHKQIAFTIVFNKVILKKYKQLQNLSSFQIKIIVKKQYPAQVPLWYCIDNHMIELGFQPFRDYSHIVLSEWNVRNTLVQIIKISLDFVESYNIQKSQKGAYLLNQTFQIQKIFTWNFLQIFPVKLISQQKPVPGFLIINCSYEVIFLQQASLQTYILRDLINFHEIISIFNSKNFPNQLLLEIRKNKQKYAFLFISDDKQTIVNLLIQYLKIDMEKKQLLFQQNNSSNSQQTQNQSEQQNQIIMANKQKQKNNIIQDSKIAIQEIQQAIVLYESLIESKMTSENVNSLISLLNKAIQYYSMIGKDFSLYLQKLKHIMMDEVAQALIDSEFQKQSNSVKTQQKQININFWGDFQ